MRDLRKKITIPFRLLELLVLSVIFGLSLWTCSTKNLIGTEKVGSIFVNANVPGANIWLDDNPTGKQTPDILKNIKVGKHKVSVRKEGYNSNPEFNMVEVVEGGLDTVNFSLTNKVSAISVNSIPANANIILDHVSTGKITPDTIFDVIVGDHVVSVTRGGFIPSPDSLVITVNENQTSTAEFILLDTLHGSLKVFSNVYSATICIDNRPTTEVTPHAFSDNDVPVGAHIISIFKKGYANDSPTKEVVRRATNDTVKVDFHLTPAEIGQAEGNITPDFELQDDYGSWHRYYAYRGFVTLIFFWAKSCYYCMVEMPDLQEIYQDYLADSLIIFGINYEDDFSVIRQIRDEKKITFTFLKGVGTNVKSDFGVTGTPVTIILDRGGKIYYYKVGYSSSLPGTLRQKLDGLFGK